ncbi:hypothetical protein GW750_00585 [bacterium]|nr:hypothetical protein [bacterium]
MVIVGILSNVFRSCCTATKSLDISLNKALALVIAMSISHNIPVNKTKSEKLDVLAKIHNQITKNNAILIQ